MHTLPRRTGGLRDMQNLYGGSCKWSGERGVTEYESVDGSITGRQKPWTRRLHRGEPKSLVTIKYLEVPEQAARWTALQAYNARAGQPLSQISMETPGLQFAREFAEDQRAKGMRNQEAIEKDGLRVYAAPSSEMRLIFDFPDKEVSVFEVKAAGGGSLLEFTHLIADGYEGMLACKDPDPRNTVAKALGASSLDQLDQAWEAGAKAASPLEAGRAVLGVLLPQE